MRRSAALASLSRDHREARVAARAAESGGPTVFWPVGRPLDAAVAAQPEEALA
jgi:hypothetical protein